MDRAPVRDNREDGPGLVGRSGAGLGLGAGSQPLVGRACGGASVSSWENPGFSLSPKGVGDGKMPSVWREAERSLGLLGGEIGSLSRNH